MTGQSRGAALQPIGTILSVPGDRIERVAGAVAARARQPRPEREPAG